MDEQINKRWVNAVVSAVKSGFYSKEGNEMKLTKTDKEMLLCIGVREEDFAQIQEVMQVRYTSYELNGEKISRDKAIEILGRKKFLAGLSRSAFHYTAVSIADSGERVYFDSSKYFRS